MIRWLAVLAVLPLFALSACGGGGSENSTTPSNTARATATLSPLERGLTSILITSSDLPEGMEGASATFSTNDDIAHGDQTQLATLAAVGRQLGADVQFIPTDRLDPDSPLRGGLESSASVYTTDDGASQTFRDTAEQARQNDWEANYPSIANLEVHEMPQTFGDESVWLRISGTAQCSFVETPTPGPGGVVPTPTCEDTKLVVLDNIIFREGRVRGFLQVSTLFPPAAPTDIYASQVAAWVLAMVARAQTAFPA